MSGSLERRLKALEAAGEGRREPIRVLRVIVGPDGKPGKTYVRTPGGLREVTPDERPA